MITTSTVWQFGSYENDRDRLLKISEYRPLYLYGIGQGSDSSALRPKIGSDGHVVIGYGFDLFVNSPTYVITRLQGAGLSFTPEQITTITNTLNAYQAGTKNSTDTASDLNFINLGTEPVAALLLSAVANDKEAKLDNRLALYGISLPESRERAALASMAYNGGTWVQNPLPGEPQGLIGPMLMTALSEGNRAEAWYQIRYQSNGGTNFNIKNGIATRRAYEASLFGLYESDSNTPTIDESLGIYAMFTRHRE